MPISSRFLLRALRISPKPSTTLRCIQCRPASLPRNLYLNRHIPSRSYATEPLKPNKPSKKNEVDAGKDKKTNKDHSKVDGSSVPKSAESKAEPKSDAVEFYSGLQRFESPTGYSRMTRAEIKEFNHTIEEVRSVTPKFMIRNLEEARDLYIQIGWPDDVRDSIKRLQKDKLTASKMAELGAYVVTSFTETKALVDAAMAESKTTSDGQEPKLKQKSEKDQKMMKDGQEPKAEQKTKEEPGPSDPKSESDQSPKKRPLTTAEIRFDMTTFLISIFTTYLLWRLVSPGQNTREITWQELRKTFLDKGLVEKLVVVPNGVVTVHLHREAVAAMYPESPAVQPNFNYIFKIGSTESFERHLTEAQDDLDIPGSERIPVQYTYDSPWTTTLMTFGPTLLFIGAIYAMSRRGPGGGGASGIFGMGRSRAKKFNHETDIKVKFADVAGMDEAKREIMEFVSFLREPGQYEKLGAKIPRGAILSGPPGTGKTLLAKATAGESGVPFFSVSGSEFVEMFVGVGASRVRDLFTNARKSTPCIIFIDEIDAIGKSRNSGKFGGGNDEREATLNQILTEMDGFNTSEQVVVLAGTNRADILDSALMRPGRFDRHITIDKPTMEGRKQIFRVHLKKIVTKVDSDYLEGRLAALTPGFSGADIANCVNEAALIAARTAAESVTTTHFEKAIERVVGGLEKRSLVLSPEEKRTVAYHEAGHAICGWFFRWADPLLKVSIIPRGSGALGYAQYLPAGDTYLLNVNQIMDRLAMTLGGRVSEEIHFETVTTGGSDDFDKVSRMATSMVTKWGMSAKIGLRSYESNPSEQLHKPFSEETARDIDAEVRRIVDAAHKQCKDLLTARKKEIGIVAEELLKKEELTRDDMVRLLGPREWEEKGEFAKYFDGSSPGSKGDVDGRGSTIPEGKTGGPAQGIAPGSAPGTSVDGAICSGEVKI